MSESGQARHNFPGCCNATQVVAEDSVEPATLPSNAAGCEWTDEAVNFGSGIEWCPKAEDAGVGQSVVTNMGALSQFGKRCRGFPRESSLVLITEVRFQRSLKAETLTPRLTPGNRLPCTGLGCSDGAASLVDLRRDFSKRWPAARKSGCARVFSPGLWPVHSRVDGKDQFQRR